MVLSRPDRSVKPRPSHEDQDPAAQELQVAEEGRLLPDRQGAPAQDPQPAQPPQAQARGRTRPLIDPPVLCPLSSAPCPLPTVIRLPPGPRPGDRGAPRASGR